jgi:6-phosphogluconolactonase
MKTYFVLWGLFLSLLSHAQPGKEIIYAGTYSIRDGKGVYVLELNRLNGNLKIIQTIQDLESPTYLEIHPSKKYLYAVNRGPIIKGDSYGSATAYAIDPKTGKLTFINNVSSYGKDPCHITFDKSGNWAFISNYSEGNFVMVPVFEDGSLGAPSDSKKYSGQSVNRLRQAQPHIHSAQVSADNRFVYVSDLGTDKIYTYSIDTVRGKIIPALQSEVSVTAGAGPRHFALHPSGSFAYSSQELTSTVGAFEVDRSNGALSLLRDTIRSLGPDVTEINTSADIHVDPSGRFVYMSNRGADAISVFSILADGSLELKGTQKTMGKTPRNFLVDIKGKYLWVANQTSDNITVFKINPKDGMLTYTGFEISIPSPVCLKHLVLEKN